MIPEMKLPPLASIPSEHQRSHINTFLSLTQWCRVIVKEEFFYYFSHNKTHQFPYLKNIILYWKYYFKSLKSCNMVQYGTYSNYGTGTTHKTDKNKTLHNSLNKSPFLNNAPFLNKAPFYYPAHIKNFFKGVLFTLEYFFKLTYDSLVYRLRKNWGYCEKKSYKEEIIDMMLEEYLEFLKNNDWYEFDFFSRIKAYLGYKRKEGEKWGFCEVEKNIFLIASFSFKQLIAYFIKLHHKLNYTSSDKTTVIELDDYPSEFEYNMEIRVVGEYQKHILLELPRYRGIKEYVRKIPTKNRLYSIAGNSGRIIVSCLFKHSSQYLAIKMRPVMVHDVNDKGDIRVVYAVPIPLLQGFIRFCYNRKIVVENILDF